MLKVLIAIIVLFFFTPSFAATTVYNNTTTPTDDSGDSGLSIRMRFTPGANSAGGTLTVQFVSFLHAWTANNVYACTVPGTNVGSAVYNCSSAPVLLCSSLSVPGAGTQNCSSASAFSFTTASNIVICAEITSANGPAFISTNTGSVGTALATSAAAVGSQPCNTQTPNLPDNFATLFYLTNNVVSNASAASGATPINLFMYRGIPNCSNALIFSAACNSQYLTGILGL